MSKSWKPTGITYRHVNCVAENVKRGKYLGTIGMGRLASIILDLLKGPLKKINHTVNHTPYRFPKCQMVDFPLGDSKNTFNV